MLIETGGTGPCRLVVMAYDIGCPRRANRVRRVLDSVSHAKQYSVYETLLGEGKLQGVLAEIRACCDWSADDFALWWPVDGVRLVWRKGQMNVDSCSGEACHNQRAWGHGIGNFMICYDVSDSAALRAVAGEVAAQCAMVQRSVYWLRASASRLAALLQHCAPHLTQGDRLWAYPLATHRHLRTIGTLGRSVVPIATHHW